MFAIVIAGSADDAYGQVQLVAGIHVLNFLSLST